MAKPITFKPGTKIDLADVPSRIDQKDFDKASAKKQIEDNAQEMADLARCLYAENKRSILLVLQGMDTAGKDGTIRAVMRGLNPRSCQVTSFKKPSEEELDHDFLWRIHHHTPRKGNIGIFNRSHYEDVLVVRVHNLVPKNIWKERYELINDFEKLLTENGTIIVKCYLHISHQEQRERLQARIDEPKSRWKFNPADLEERKHWSAYQEAYEAALEKCNTRRAPWYIIPSDQKWYRNLVVSNLMKETMKELSPKFPTATEDFKDIQVI
ncbi:MAG: polyphosphate kinase 2 family protein, partial [Planctomycetota bacterium]